MSSNGTGNSGNGESNVTTVNFVKPDDPKKPLLRLHADDDVGVALRALRAGEEVTAAQGDAVTVAEDIPKGHKIALTALATGARVQKYAQLIGYASVDIGPGQHVHTHNLEFRNTDQVYQFATESGRSDYQSNTADTDTFEGFRREDGRVGTRNYIAVISSVNCSASAAKYIAAYFDDARLATYDNIDGVVAFTHATGCGLADSGDGFDNLQRVFKGYAIHPNVAAVLIVGLGCEVSQIQTLVKEYGLERGPLLATMNIQTTGGHRKTVDKGIELLEGMLPAANQCKREACPVSALTLALQCGGSDAWSGITANPALGVAADLLVAAGGTAVLAETPEVYGAEHLLTRRAIDEQTGQKLIERIAWWEDYVERNSGSMDNNPSPGNKLGGLTTILEKSLGAVAKGGSSRLTGVYRYAEQIDRKGFVFMDTPGYDPASITGEVAGGCNLVAFTTGRGSTYGCKPSPSIKIATNTDMYDHMQDDMDINAGKIVSDGASVEEVGQEIFSYLVNIASGKPSLSEAQGIGDNEFIPWQIGATM